MKKLTIFIILGLTLFNHATVQAQIISTVAGSGICCFGGDNGPATASKVNQPYSVALDALGNLYIGDADNHRIRKVSAAGIISTYAGDGTSGYGGDGGLATAAQVNRPVDLVLDGSGNLYFVEGAGNKVRKISSSGIITTIAGTGTYSHAGDGGPATAATFSGVNCIAIDASNNLYIGESGKAFIRKITASGIISTIAGTIAGFGGDGGAATAAKLNEPRGIAVDAAGNVYFTDDQNSRIRKISTSGIIKSIAGTGCWCNSGDGGPATAAGIYEPIGIAVDGSGNILFADWGNNSIRKINSSGIISTVAGNGTAGYSGDGGAATAAMLHQPYDVAIGSGGKFYIADNSNLRVRVVEPVYVHGFTSVCSPGSATSTTDTLGSNVPAGAWSSSSTAVATVGTNGVVTSKAAGIVTINYVSSLGSASISLSITPPPAAIHGSSLTCIGTPTALTDISTGGTWSSSNTAAAIVSGSGIVTGVASGSAVITYMISTGCSVLDTISIDALPASPLHITGSSSLCVGATTTLSDGTAGGVWSSSASATASISTAGLVSGLLAGTATISYSVSNSCGSAEVTSTVTVIPLPAMPGAITGTTSLCVGTTTSLTNAVSGGVWSSGNTAVATVGSTGSVNGTMSGTSTISYTIANSCGSNSAAVSVMVDTLPDAGSITGIDSVCLGDSILLSDLVSGGTWNSRGLLTSVSGAGFVTGVSAGLDTISYSVTNHCGTTSAIKEVFVRSYSECHPSTLTQTIASDPGFSLYPNPNNGSFKIKVDESRQEELLLTLTNYCGQKLRTQRINSNEEIEIQTGLPSGIYFIAITSPTKRIIKNVTVQ